MVKTERETGIKQRCVGSYPEPLIRRREDVKSHLCTILPKECYQSHKNSLLLSTDVSIKPLKFLKCQNELVVIIVFKVSFIRSLFNTHLCAGRGGLGL